MSFEKFQYVVGRMIGTEEGRPGLTGLAAGDQFRPEENDPEQVAQNLNAAFLIALAGPGHHLYSPALQCLDLYRQDPEWGLVVSFLNNSLFQVEEEVRDRCSGDRLFAEDLDSLVVWLTGNEDPQLFEAVDRVYTLLFPEGAAALRSPEEQVRSLRNKRGVRIDHLNPEPVTSPGREVLFTSNVLLTLPLAGTDPGHLPLSREIRDRLGEISLDEQKYWYDHPIPLGIKADRNEAVYGMRNLEEAIRWEVDRGNMPEKGRVSCLLSVSATHDGLQGIARKYLEEEFAAAGVGGHLDLYVVTEGDAVGFLEEVLLPAGRKYLRKRDYDDLKRVFGVEGRYGRHYSFLKAVAALWQVLIDPGIRATFKVDLDQVFPQRELVAETGRSAFEHLMTPLWGAGGIDSDGNRVELGMIAGALVNEADIGKGLYTPDVRWPPLPDPSLTSTPSSPSSAAPVPPPYVLEPDQWVFFSQLPQALSTEAEMMARYDRTVAVGTGECLQRVHVTGGTTGILIDSLRRHRPFTPTFVARAEDQAYLMSVLYAENGANLRYVHADGLFMRHDKEAFAREAIEAARLGKTVGDLVRILIYTSYARSLPWGADRIKDALDPFTGCFVSRVPITVTCLRMALTVAKMFHNGSPAGNADARDLLVLSCQRLADLAGRMSFDPYPLSARFWSEREGWHIFYDILDELEAALARGDQYAADLRAKALEVVADWKLRLSPPS